MFAAAFWTVAWLLCNITVTLLNKAIFRVIDFKYPALLSSVHMFFTALLSTITLHYYKEAQGTKENGNPPQPAVAPDSGQSMYSWQMFLFSSLFTLNIVMGNLSLKLASVELVQITRSVIPGITMALSVLLWAKRYSLAQYSSVAIVIIGVALAMYGELELMTITIPSVIIILLGCVLSSSKSITAGRFLQNRNIPPLVLAKNMSKLAVPQMLVLSFLLGELTTVWENWDETWTANTIAALIINGMLAFFLNFSNFMFTKHTSPLTVTIAGNVKQVLTILLSVIIFQSPLTMINLTGTIIAVVGAMSYSYVQYQAKHNASKADR